MTADELLTLHMPGTRARPACRSGVRRLLARRCGSSRVSGHQQVSGSRPHQSGTKRASRILGGGRNRIFIAAESGYGACAQRGAHSRGAPAAMSTCRGCPHGHEVGLLQPCGRGDLTREAPGAHARRQLGREHFHHDFAPQRAFARHKHTRQAPPPVSRSSV